MKKILSLAAAALFACGAFAQTYPVTNPTYIPTAVLAPQTVSAPTDIVFSVSGVNTVAIGVSGTCTGLTAAPQISADSGSHYTTVQAIPAVGGSLITSITGTGLWRISTAGANRARLHISALSASCTIAMSGSPGNGATYLLNPNTTSNPTTITDQTGAYNWVVDASGNGAVKLVAGTAIAGKFGIDQTTNGTTNAVTPIASSSGGATGAHYLSAATTNSTSVTAAATSVYAIRAVNTNATTAYLKLYNKATAPTCNSDTPVLTFTLVQNVPMGIEPPVGVAFGTGLGFCITGAAADNDNTAATTGITLNLIYK